MRRTRSTEKLDPGLESTAQSRFLERKNGKISLVSCHAMPMIIIESLGWPSTETAIKKPIHSNAFKLPEFHSTA